MSPATSNSTYHFKVTRPLHSYREQKDKLNSHSISSDRTIANSLGATVFQTSYVRNIVWIYPPSNLACH